MALGAITIRDLLERKYADQERQTAIRGQDVAGTNTLRLAQGGLMGAQAGLTTTQAGLLPQTTAATIAQTQAETEGQRIQNQFAPDMARSALDVNRSNIRLRDTEADWYGRKAAADINATNAGAGLNSMQARVMGSESLTKLPRGMEQLLPRLTPQRPSGFSGGFGGFGSRTRVGMLGW